MKLEGSVPSLFYLKTEGMAEVSKNVGTVPMVREVWMMAEMRGTNEGRWALTGCIGRGSS